MVKLIFLKCILKFVIKTASPTSNNVKDRHIWFKLNNFTCSITEWQRGPSVIEVVRYQPVVMLQVWITVTQNFFLYCRLLFFLFCFVLFSFYHIFPFPSFVLFLLLTVFSFDNLFLVWIGILFLWLAQW